MPTTHPSSADSQALLRRLVDATNAHDVEAIVQCFAVDYRNETPAHPGRGFVGKSHVRRNWRQIFADIPDIVVDVVDSIGNDAHIWSEWEMHGTRRDGQVDRLRGVIIFRVDGQRMVSARFYLEQVDVVHDASPVGGES